MSDDLRARLDEWDALSEAASPGPWQYLRRGSWGGASAVATSTGHPLAFVGDPDVTGVDQDAAFIAASRTALPAASAALRTVLDLHRPYDAGFGPCCAGCESVPVYKVWPCATVRRITAALTQEP